MSALTIRATIDTRSEGVSHCVSHFLGVSSVAPLGMPWVAAVGKGGFPFDWSGFFGDFALFTIP